MTYCMNTILTVSVQLSTLIHVNKKTEQQFLVTTMRTVILSVVH